MRHFSAWEMRYLQEFLASPFHNKRSDVVQLLEIIVTEFKKKKMDLAKETVFEKIYPDEPFNETNFNLLCSYLYKLVEKFLAYQQLNQDEVLLKQYTAKAFREKKLEKYFEKALSDSTRLLTKKSLRNPSFLRKAFDLEYDYYNYLGSQSRSVENNLQELSNAFDAYFIAEKLKQHCFQIAHKTVFKKEYTEVFFKEVLLLLEKEPTFLNQPAIAIYYHCYKAITESTNSEYHFQQLRDLLEKQHQYFTLTEIRSIYIFAINFCIKRVNSGESQFVLESFNLYKTGLEVNILIDNEEISPYTFNNIAFMGLKLERFDWVENFIQDYQKYLPFKKRESVSQYTLGVLRYEQKNYKEAMKLMVTFNSRDHLMNLGAKTTLLKIYYELKEFEVLEFHLDSMRIYLQRKDIVGYHREIYKNVIIFTRKLMTLSMTNSKEKQLFIEDLEILKVASLKEWFKRQVG